MVHSPAALTWRMAVVWVVAVLAATAWVRVIAYGLFSWQATAGVALVAAALAAAEPARYQVFKGKTSEKPPQCRQPDSHVKIRTLSHQWSHTQKSHFLHRTCKSLRLMRINFTIFSVGSQREALDKLSQLVMKKITANKKADL